MSEANRNGVPIVLCCAADNRFEMAPVIELLGRKGHTVELISGVDLDAGLLESAVERRKGQGLYVLCRSDALDNVQFSRLQEVLRRFKVSNSAILALAFEPEDPEGVVQPIADMVQRFRRSRQTLIHTPGKPTLPSEKVGAKPPLGAPPALKRGPGAPPPAPKPSASRTLIANSAPSAGASPAASAGISAGASPGASPATSPATKPRPAAPPTQPQPAVTAAAQVPAQAPSTPKARPPSTPPFEPASDADDELLDEAGLSGNPLAPLLAALQKVPRVALLGGGVAALLLVAGGSLVMCGADEDPEDEAVASASKDDADGEEAEAGEAVDAAKAEAEAKPDPAAEAEAEPALEPEAEAEPEPVAEAEPEPEPEPAPEPELAPTDAGKPEIGSAAEQDLIDAAVRARRIRVLDILLIDTRRSKRVRFDGAEKWCEGREIENVEGWRLPSVGEVSSLTLSGVIKRDYYWSQTKGDTFGDRMLVWSGKRKRIQPKSKRWRGARAICVRTRDGLPPDENEMEVEIDE